MSALQAGIFAFLTGDEMLLIHVGVQKAGSTWLQKEVFPTFKDVTVLTKEIESYAIFHRYLIYGKPVGDDEDSQQRRDTLDRLLAEIESEDRTYLLSSEGLSGSQYLKGFDQNAIKQRIQELNCEKKILLLVREQKSLLRSIYKQYVLDGGTLDEDQFQDSRLNAKFLDVGFFDFQSKCELWMDCVTKDNFKVMAYEDISRYGHQTFAAKIGEFFGLELSGKVDERWVRTGLTGTRLRMVRWFNRYCSSNLNPHGGFTLHSSVLGMSLWRLTLLVNAFFKIEDKVDALYFSDQEKQLIASQNAKMNREQAGFLEGLEYIGVDK